VATACISIVFNLLLIPPLAAQGAAIALVVIQSFGTLWVLVVVNRTIHHQFRGRVLVRALLASAVMGSVLLWLRQANLVLVVIVGAAVYLATIVSIRGLRWDDVAALFPRSRGSTTP
jgi:O-antigen/teichoic acid export membrane protein